MPDITLVLHNIRSTYNVGALFRTAEGFGVKRLVLTGYTPYPTTETDIRLPHLSKKITQQIHKSALGAESMLPFDHYDDLETFLTVNTLPIIALEQDDAAISIREYAPPEKFALLLGEEVHGIEPRHLAGCSAILEIPMKGKKESFNVSVAAGIALYALTN